MSRNWRRFVVPVITTFIMFVILMSLGTWQVFRLHWKERILAQIATAEAAPPVPLPAAPNPFIKVSVTGRYRFDEAAEYGAEVRDTPSGPQLGYDQIVPLQRAAGPPLLVDRGWVPRHRARPLDDPSGIVTVVGYVHSAVHPGLFSAADNPAERRFYTLDPAIIGKALGQPDVAPFILVALGPAMPGSYPEPAQHLPRPPNNHFVYLMTWYSLAVALLFVFGAWFRKALRE